MFPATGNCATTKDASVLPGRYVHPATHLQALIALARRRVIVVYAMLRDQTGYADSPRPEEYHPITTVTAA